MSRKYVNEKLTDPEIKREKPREKLFSIPDGGNLRLFIYPSGTKVWRWSYKIHGVNKVLTIGQYPGVSLKEAREARKDAKDLVTEGIDPSAIKKSIKITFATDSFKVIADRWLSESKSDWSAGHYKRESSSLEKDLYPFIGQRRIQDLTQGEIIDCIKRVANRGALDSSKRLKYRIGQIYDYAMNYELVTVNKASAIDYSKLQIERHVPKSFAAILEPVRFGQLLRDIEEYNGGVSVTFSLKLAPYLAMRPSELTGGRWFEIDLDEGIWTLPASRRKLPTHLKKRNQKIDELVIPLSKQAAALLRDLHDYTGRGKLLFPGQRGNDRPLSENALRVALRSMGYSNDDQTAHGFRHSFSTLMNERNIRDKIVIDAILGHKIVGEVEGSYNKATYLKEKSRILQEWADYIDRLRSGGDVIEINRRA